MPLLLQVCVVVVTIAIVALVMSAMRTLTRLQKTLGDFNSLNEQVRHSLTRVDRLTDEAQGVLVSVRDVVPAVRRVVGRFESIGDRAADISAAVLEEVEAPVYTAVALVRGVRSTATQLIQRLAQRFTHRSTTTNGGSIHE